MVTEISSPRKGGFLRMNWMLLLVVGTIAAWTFIGITATPVLLRRKARYDKSAGGWHGRQPVFFMVFHASMALCRSIRRRVIGSGGRGGT